MPSADWGAAHADESIYCEVRPNIIFDTVGFNATHKHCMTDERIRRKPNVASTYSLIMNDGPDYFRAFGTQGITKRIRAKGIEALFYESP
jgi:hypothetical protein